jgi:uncharacterized protein (DUF849 family)
MDMNTAYEKLCHAEPCWKSPMIVESHINGLRTKEYNPNIPVGYEEVAVEAIKCWEAGACGIHVHNTNMKLIGTEAYEDYMRVMEPAIKKYPDIFWYSTLSDVSGHGEDASGLEHAELLAKNAGMKICCVDPGAANLPFFTDADGHIHGVGYYVPFSRINKQVDLCNRNNLGIIWGVYEPGYLRTALRYIKMGRSPKGSTIDLYFLGDYGSLAMQPVNTCGVPPTIESLYFYLDMMKDCDLPWFVSIWGEGGADTTPLLKRVIELGGHIKTGLELHFDPNRKPTNVELLQEVQALARSVGRPLAKQHEVNDILGLA